MGELLGWVLLVFSAKIDSSGYKAFSEESAVLISCDRHLSYDTSSTG
jgi:hypothetical protein